MIWAGAVTTALSLAAILILIATVWWYGRKAADVDPEILRDYRPAQVTRVLARDGTVIGELVFEERRTLVAYERLPQHLVDAFLAAEDADFFEHDGLDWPGIARAAFVNLTRGQPRQGASTITQQVIKNTLLSQVRSVERKSQEILLAGRVEATLSKRRIFEIYVNQIYFGEGRYGVEEAARWYFGKSVDAVDLGEAAVLAALPRAPGVVTCYRRVDELAARRDYVLRQMVEHGFASADEIAPFLGAPIRAMEHGPAKASGPVRPASGLGEADEFVDLARAELIRRYGEEALPTLGATVTTSVDLALQRAARSAGARELDELEARHGYGSHARPLSTRARKRLEAKTPQLAAGARQSVIIDGHDHCTLAADPCLRGHVGSAVIEVELAPNQTESEIETKTETAISQRFPVGAALSVRVVTVAVGGEGPALATLDPGPELALLLADVRSGELLAAIGGRDYSRGGFDRSRLAQRQPGSTFKPVVYGAALRSRQFTAATTGRGGPKGEPMRLREALAQSDNAVALALMRALGPEPVHTFARDLGITAPLGPHLSLALGTSELAPLELLTAYLTLARSGSGIDPKAILEVEVAADLDGHRPQPIADPIQARLFSVDAAVAGVLTSMLTSVVREGTGKQAAALGRPVAGKTGTTDDARDAWFAGFTPDHAAVAWVGFDEPRSLGAQESGSALALPIWLAAMDAASEGLPVRDFDRPKSLVHALVDETGGGPACREAAYWYQPERCTRGLFFDHCEPASWREREPFLQCVGPQRWLDEWFLPGTEPGDGPAPAPIGERPTTVDPNERGGEAPIFADVEIASVSLFASQPDTAALRKALAPLERSLLASWRRALDGDRDQRQRSWGYDSPPAPGTRLRLALQLRADGSLAHLRTLAGADPLLDQWAEAAVHQALRSPPVAMPAALLEPGQRQAELRVDLIVGQTQRP